MMNRIGQGNTNLDRLPTTHKKIFSAYTNTMGERMCT